MSKEKQIESCENCLHYSACLINGEYVPTPCRAYEDKASYRKQSEVLDDLEDLLIDFDEMGFCPITLVPDPEGYAVEWKRKLVNALQGYRKQSEGEWIWKSNGYMKCLHCSCCGNREDWEYKFCPNCGARMKGGVP